MCYTNRMVEDQQKQVCTTCEKTAEGYKCEQCGAEAKTHDPEHKPCGAEHCVQKCVGCDKAETKCSC